MMFRAIPFIAAALVAAPIFAQAMTPDDYVKMAGASDLFEIQSSQIVLGSTQDAKLKAFANRMIRDHTKSTADVKAAAMKAGMTPPPPMLTPAQSDQIAQLQSQTGTARDTTYVSQQRASHDQALALQQGYAADGTSPPLKAAAKKIVPVVQHHIDMLKTM